MPEQIAYKLQMCYRHDLLAVAQSKFEYQTGLTFDEVELTVQCAFRGLRIAQNLPILTEQVHKCDHSTCSFVNTYPIVVFRWYGQQHICVTNFCTLSHMCPFRKNGGWARIVRTPKLDIQIDSDQVRRQGIHNMSYIIIPEAYICQTHGTVHWCQQYCQYHIMARTSARIFSADSNMRDLAISECPVTHQSFDIAAQGDPDRVVRMQMGQKLSASLESVRRSEQHTKHRHAEILSFRLVDCLAMVCGGRVVVGNDMSSTFCSRTPQTRSGQNLAVNARTLCDKIINTPWHNLACTPTQNGPGPYLAHAAESRSMFFSLCEATRAKVRIAYTASISAVDRSVQCVRPLLRVMLAICLSSPFHNYSGHAAVSVVTNHGTVLADHFIKAAFGFEKPQANTIDIQSVRIQRTLADSLPQFYVMIPQHAFHTFIERVFIEFAEDVWQAMRDHPIWAPKFVDELTVSNKAFLHLFIIYRAAGMLHTTLGAVHTHAESSAHKHSTSPPHGAEPIEPSAIAQNTLMPYTNMMVCVGTRASKLFTSANNIFNRIINNYYMFHQQSAVSLRYIKGIDARFEEFRTALDQ